MSSYAQQNSYGPPKHIKPKGYHPVLEMLETKANESCLEEYLEEIYQTMSMNETQNSTINCSMIDLQPEIAWYMRPALLDFLIDVHNSLRLQHETLFRAMFILDNYCAKRVVFKKHYQLVGCTALWIASKYEDKKSRVPTLKELTMMCRNVYDQDMFVQMEMHILSTLNWNLNHTSLEDCLQICLKNSSDFITETPTRVNNKFITKKELKTSIEQLSRFFMELTLYERNFIQFPNSLVAFTCHLLASKLLNSNAAINSFEVSVTRFYEQQLQDLNNQGAENEEDFFIENDENEYPMNNVIPPFFSGWNEDESIESIFKILILLVVQLVNIKEVSHILPAKYPEFQPLLKAFLTENDVLLSYLNVNPGLLNNAADLKLDQNQSQACHYLIGLSSGEDDEEEEEEQMYDSNHDIYSEYTTTEFAQPRTLSGQPLPLTPPSASSAMFSDSHSLSSYSSSPPIPSTTTMSHPQQTAETMFYQATSSATTSSNHIPTPIENEFKKPNVRSAFQNKPYSQNNNYGELDEDEMPASSPLRSRYNSGGNNVARF